MSINTIVTGTVAPVVTFLVDIDVVVVFGGILAGRGQRLRKPNQQHADCPGKNQTEILGNQADVGQGRNRQTPGDHVA
jgi:hypothetical protein